jgi:hypothetical protein
MSQQSAVRPIGSASAPGSWRADLAHLVWSAWQRLRTSVLLWATFVRPSKPATHAPDPFSTEASFLKDDWMRE